MGSNEITPLILAGIVTSIGGFVSAVFTYLTYRRKTQTDKDTAIEAAKIAHLAELNATEERRRNAEYERIAKGYEQLLAASNAALGDCRAVNAKLIEKSELTDAHIDELEKHNVTCEIRVAGLTERVTHLELGVKERDARVTERDAQISDLRARLDKMPKPG